MIEAKREKIQRIQGYLVWRRDKIGYAQRRPMITRNIDTMTKLEAWIAKGGGDIDCSEATNLLFHVAGCKSPSGSWSLGNTETFLEHQTHHYYDARQALPGAIVIFNSNRPLWEQHAATVHEADPLWGDPILFTHGNAADPHFLKLSWLQAGFSGSTTFLSVSNL